MSPNEIYQDILLLDKSITLQFPSIEALNVFRSSLHGARKRIRDELVKCGMDDCEDGTIELTCKVVKNMDGTSAVKGTFRLSPLKPKHLPYIILSISDSPPEDTSDAP